MVNSLPLYLCSVTDCYKSAGRWAIVDVDLSILFYRKSNGFVVFFGCNIVEFLVLR